MSTHGHDADSDYSASRPFPGAGGGISALRVGALVAALAGAVLLMIADFSTLYDVKVLTVVKKTVIGHDQHNFALLIIGITAIPMALGAARGRSRPAMLALVVLGAIALGIALIGDANDVSSTGVIGTLYENAGSTPGFGFYAETLGAALLVLAGGLQLLLAGRPPHRPPLFDQTAPEPSPGPGEPVAPI